MNDHHSKKARPGPALLRAVTIIAMLIGQFSTVQVAYAQTTGGEAGNQIFLPYVSGSDETGFVEQETAPTEPGDTQEGTIKAATAADFKTTDWAAAAPYTYNHATGGGAYNNRTVGDHNDITEQLEGGQFTCGDTVTYLAQLTMENNVVEPAQTARMSFSFLANSTGQAGAALAEILDADINYGLVENGDNYTGINPGVGFFGYDSGISDDRQAFDGVNVIDPAGTGANSQNGSTLTIVSAGLIDANDDSIINDDDLFLSNSELLLTIDIDDLEAGETVVARIDVLLRCQAGSNPTGNLQGKLDSVIALPSGQSASSGAQTLPFLKVGELEGAGDPLLNIEKTVTTETGTCGVDDVEQLTVDEGDTVKYCYVVTNPGTADLFDLQIPTTHPLAPSEGILDDNGSPGDTSDDFVVSLNGLADLDGDADFGDLASVGTATGEALVTFSSAGTVVNTATTTGNNGKSGGQFAELTDSDTAEVTTQDVLPTATLTKTAVPTEVTEPGGDVTFTVVVQNTSTVETLTLSDLSDNIYGNITQVQGDIVSTNCSVSQTLDPDDSAAGGTDEYTCSFVAAVNGLAGSSHTDTVTATLADDDGNTINPFDDAKVDVVAPAAGTVSGHLYIDSNGNGTQDEGEPDLANVDVIITDSNNVQQTVTTDEFGNWTATVPPGTTSADVDETDPDYPTGYTQTEGDDPTTVTAVAGVDTSAGNDGYYQAGDVSGHLYIDSNGNGTQDEGEPDLANVDVIITDSNNVQQTVTTDEFGNWTATVPPGTTSADVDETDPDYPTGYTQTEGDDPTTVTAVAGADTSAGNDGYYQAGTVSGHLYIDSNGNGTQDEGEPDLANVDVIITDSNNVQQTVTTDEFGNWTATVPPGTTSADVDETDPDYPTGYTQTEGDDPTTVTAVAGADTSAGNDGYYQAGTVSGHLYIDSNGNGTQDEGEPDLANVDVIITDSNNVQQTVTTDEFGNWTATVPPGTTSADVDETDPDYPTGYTQTEGDDPTTVTAVAGADTSAGNDGYYQAGTVSGHLYIDSNGNGTQDEGEPDLANVDVIITDSNNVQQTVTTDEFGNWTATVPPGTTSADVDETDPDYPTGYTQTEGDDPTTVTAVAGADTSAGNDGYYQAGTVSGHLYIDSNGNGTQDEGEPDLANVDVIITDSNNVQQTVTTDEFGNWTATVPPGTTSADVDETDPDYPAGYTQTEGDDPTTVTAVAGEDTSAGNDGYFLPNPVLSVDKVLTNNADEDTSGTISLNDTLTYQITASNDGNVTLNNVAVSDDLTGDSTSCLSVAPGGTCVLTVTYVVTQADVDAGQIVNTGTADSDETPPTEDPNTEPVPQNPAIQIVKSSSLDLGADGIATPGDIINYSFAVTNIGDVTLTDVTVNDPTAGVTDCVIGTMAPGAVDNTCSGSYTLTLADIDRGSVFNQAFVAGEAPGGDPADPADDITDDDTNTQNIPQNPALSVDKALTANDDADGSESVSLGDTLTYVITASNDGNVTLNNVTVSDSLTGDDTTCLSVAPGGTCVLTVTYVVTQADVDAGEILNTGVADSDETPPTEDPEDVPVPQNPALSVDKVLTNNADEDTSGTISLNDTLTYQITASNDGNVTLNNVTVSDDLTGDSTSCLSVAPGGTCVLVVTYVVTQGDVDAGEIVNTGTADSDETPPTDDPNTEPVPQNPVLSVDKVLTNNADEDTSGTISLNDTLTYQITASNDGNVTLNNVAVSDDLTGDSTSCLSVAPGGTCVLTVTYVVTQADVDAGEIVNTGTADSDETPPTEDPNTEPVPQNPAIQIVKSSSLDLGADGIATPGDVINYSFEVTNIGDVTLTDVTVNDATAGVTGCVIGTMAPAAVDDTTCSGSYVLTQTDIDNGSVFNQAFVGAEAPGGDTEDPGDDVTDDDDNTQNIPQTAALSVVKSLAAMFMDNDGSGDITLGDGLLYAFNVTNIGNVTLNSVSVTDETFSIPVTCSAATLLPDESTPCLATLYHIVPVAEADAGEVINTATATGTGPQGQQPEASDTLTTPVEQDPSIALIKTGTFQDENGDGFANVGETISYNFTVTNDGNVTLTDVTLADTVGGVSISGGPIATLAVNASDSTTFSGSYTITQVDIDNGSFYNLATATGTDPNNDPTSDTDTHTEDLPQNPSINLVKTGTFNDENGDGFANVDETIVYAFTVTNDGNVTLTDVTLADTVGGVSISGGPIATLAVNASDSTTFSGSYTITQDDIDSGSFFNLATATGTDPNGDPTSDTDTHTEDLPQNPSINLVKTGSFNDEDGDGFANVGETISYAFTVTNDGNVTLTDVTLADTVGGVSISGGPIATLAVNASDSTTFSGSYTITQVDIDNGSFYNLATATGTDPNNDPTSDTDTHTEDLPQNPSINLVKTGTFNDENGDGFANVDETIVYAFTVTNDGNVTLTDVTLADTVGGVSISGGPIATLAVNASDSTTFSGSYTITQDDIDSGSFFNLATATGTDPNGDPTSDTDTHTEDLPQNPSINLVKTGSFNDEDGDGFANVGETISYAFTVTNDGNVTLTDVTLADTVGGVSISGGPIATLAVNASDSTTFSGSYTITQADIDAGHFNNVATVTATDPNGDPTSDDDNHDEELPQNPVISIIKTFADDSIIAGGAGSSFTLVVTNEGNVTLSDALIEDTVDDRVTVTGVSGTSGTDADTDGDAQTVEWLISTLGVGQSATLTVDFTVDSAVEEANGVGGVNDGTNVPNVATVAAEAPLGDPDNPGDDITDTDDDTIDILVDIDLSIVKTFDPTSVPQGTAQSFTIEVSNAGPSDAVDVSVTDSVHGSLAVTGVNVTSGSGDCSASAGQEVDCTVQIPAGESVLITVDYVTAPFLSGDPSPYGTQAGDDFRFVFVNGSILEGSTGGGRVYLDGVDITADVTILSSLTRNDLIFDPPGDDPAFEMHLSCSDPFTGGWGQSAGPVEGVDENWQIAYFSIARYNSQGFFKNCGNVVNEFDVPNTATATGEDSSGTETVSDDATVTVTAGIKLDRLQTNGKRLTVRLTNFTGDSKEIVDVSAIWPTGNGDLTKVWLTYDRVSVVIWSGNDAPTDALLDSSVSGWNGATLLTGEAILRFDFKNKVADSGYTIRVNFADGTFLDIAQ